MASKAVFEALHVPWEFRNIDIPNHHWELQARLFRHHNQLAAAADTAVPQIFAPIGTHIGGFQDLVRHLMARRCG